MRGTSREPTPGVAVVTGATGYLGTAIAERLAEDGAAVVANHRSAASAGRAGELVERITTRGGRAIACQADVSIEQEVDHLCRTAAEAFGPADALVNNAAASVAAQSPWESLTVADWSRVYEANVLGAFLCSRAFAPGMRQLGGGSIVNVSSVTALLGRTGNLHYVTSKAALLGFTRALAREVGPAGIRVNALVVGAIKTPDEAVYGAEEDLDDYLLGVQSLKRRGMPHDAAAGVAMLLSPEAGFITGQSIVIDGGWVMM